MTRKYKIAVVAACPFPYPRGTPIRILRMSEALAARGHDVHVITYHLGQNVEDLSFKIHRIPNIPTYHKLSPGPTYQKIAVLDPLLAVKILSVVLKERFDIIHAHHFEGVLASLPAKFLTGTPLIFDVHTLLSSELPHYAMGLSTQTLSRVGKLFDHWLPRQASHIVSVTNTIRDRLINEINISPDKITTVYTGLETDHFSPYPSSTSEAESKTLIYTGNLAPYQGVDLMFQAFRKVLDHRSETILKIVTNSSMEPYQDLVSELNIGQNLIVEEASYFQLPNKLHSAAIALNPRVYCDGFPVKLLNYMATARAIVSFEGSAEVLVNEVNGLVVPDNDVDAFAHAILDLLDKSHLVKTLGENAHRTVQEFFMWENSIVSLEEIYERELE